LYLLSCWPRRRARGSSRRFLTARSCGRPRPALPTSAGVFRSLILEELPRGQSWALYNYVSRVAVACSGDRFVVVTDYVSQRTSRALVFAIDSRGDPFAVEQVTLDKVQLARLVPAEQDVHLLANVHVFVAVTRVEKDALILRTSGYGAHDPKGFRLACQCDLRARPRANK